MYALFSQKSESAKPTPRAVDGSLPDSEHGCHPGGRDEPAIENFPCAAEETADEVSDCSHDLARRFMTKECSEDESRNWHRPTCIRPERFGELNCIGFHLGGK